MPAAGSVVAASGVRGTGSAVTDTARASAHTGTRSAARAGTTVRLATKPNGAPVDDPVRRSGGKVRAKPARDTGVESEEEQNASPRPLNPCHLVDAQQAGRILRSSHVEVQTAPQGPTCIYTPSGRPTAAVTVVIEPTTAAELARHGRLVGRLTLASRRAYCVKYGAAVLYAQLPDGSAMAVSAPCAIAAQFAALALPRLAHA